MSDERDNETKQLSGSYDIIIVTSKPVFLCKHVDRPE